MNKIFIIHSLFLHLQNSYFCYCVISKQLKINYSFRFHVRPGGSVGGFPPAAGSQFATRARTSAGSAGATHARRQTATLGRRQAAQPRYVHTDTHTDKDTSTHTHTHTYKSKFTFDRIIQTTSLVLVDLYF